MGGMVIGQAIAGGAQAWNAAQIERSTIRANNAISRANAKAENLVRSGQNVLQAASNSFARFNQSRQNRELLKAGGEQIAAVLTNAARADRSMLEAGFEGAIQHSEQMGMQAAMAASTGAGGTVVDDVNAASALRYARARGSAEKYRNTVIYDSVVKASAIMEQTQSNLNNGIILDNMDYRRSVAQVQSEPNVAAKTILGAADAIFGSSGKGPGGFGSSNDKVDNPYGSDQSAAETARLSRYEASAALQEQVQTEKAITDAYKEKLDEGSSNFNVDSGQQIYSQYLSIGST